MTDTEQETKSTSVMNRIGKNVLVRSVTHYYTGRLVSLDDNGFMRLEDAAWIADTGRFAQALREGDKVLDEVEPYPGECWISLGAVVDLCPWDHELPRTTK